jgi:hypothetical protein
MRCEIAVTERCYSQRPRRDRQKPRWRVPIRDEIRTRVEKLLAELIPGVAS